VRILGKLHSRPIKTIVTIQLSARGLNAHTRDPQIKRTGRMSHGEGRSFSNLPTSPF
jgi:hypothetical protein